MVHTHYIETFQLHQFLNEPQERLFLDDMEKLIAKSVVFFTP